MPRFVRASGDSEGQALALRRPGGCFVRDGQALALRVSEGYSPTVL